VTNHAKGVASFAVFSQSMRFASVTASYLGFCRGDGNEEGILCDLREERLPGF
jgi:hypothetical protein